MACSTDPIDLTTERTLEPALLQAISGATSATLRQILIEICMKSEICTSHVREAILVPVDLLKGTVNANIPANDIAKKRKLETVISRFANCVQCDEDFDILLNQKPGQEQACGRHEGTLASQSSAQPALTQHPGELELDHDYFVDDDDVAYGHIDVDTDWRREEFPEGFVWSCCELRGPDSEPCLRSRHSQSHNGEGQGKVFRLASNGKYEAEYGSDDDSTEEVGKDKE